MKLNSHNTQEMVAKPSYLCYMGKVTPPISNVLITIYSIITISVIVNPW